MELQRYITDLIKKERAFVSEFETSRFLGDGTGKCALFVAEQLALKKSKRDCSAIQFHECLFAATAQLVYRARDKFFAGPGLSLDQHGRIRRRHNRC